MPKETKLLRPDERRKLLIEMPDFFSRLILTGIPVNKLLKKNALIVGCGGLGVIVAEILARTGIGKLYLVDRDVVEENNFNRLGFTKEDIGRPKAEALADKLKGIRNFLAPEYHIKIEPFVADIVDWEKLEDLVREADIVLSCVDNADARYEINYYCMKHGKILIDGATSIDGFGGRILTVIPYDYPCFECVFGENTSIELGTFERVGACDASLATTFLVVGSLQAQIAINLLLKLEKPSPLILVSLYPSINITNIQLKPNENCRTHRRFAKIRE